MRPALLPCVHACVSATSCARIIAAAPVGPLRAPDYRVPLLRVCSKLCSDRVSKGPVGTRQDRMGIGTFSARTSEFRRDSRRADRPQTGLANRRLQPLGHLTANAKYTRKRQLPIVIRSLRRRRFFEIRLQRNPQEIAMSSAITRAQFWAQSR